MHFTIIFCFCVSLAHPLWVKKDVNLMVAPVVVSGLLVEGQTSTLHSPATTEGIPTTSTISKTTTSQHSSPTTGGEFYEGAGGITYSPYQKSGQCKTLEMVRSDLERLRGFSIIRIYATDCDILMNLKKCLSTSQKVMVGIWDLGKVSQGVSDISTTFNGDFARVHSVSVGNELVNSGQASAEDVQAAVSKARVQLREIGYQGPVVSVDTLVAVTANPALCGVSDFLAVNSHPYWDGNVEPSNCGAWLQNQIANLQAKCGSQKPILITESGWPNAGDTNGKCQPSQENMQRCIRSINHVVGPQVLLFSTFNDYWKDPGPKNVEQRWGIFGDPAF
ncbi:LADA_0F06722g1_1 [Lachancea dasiensis]|uniref:LADA_0F06722g1_1 n=1 Tax=Lachancea dasiensis TaxID=1072105 RepID=A0A1G4JK02_9SACH|nr:LADA_0F06722g1_1 [Lachancea dasiensis]